MDSCISRWPLLSLLVLEPKLFLQIHLKSDIINSLPEMTSDWLVPFFGQITSRTPLLAHSTQIAILFIVVDKHLNSQLFR